MKVHIRVVPHILHNALFYKREEKGLHVAGHILNKKDDQNNNADFQQGVHFIAREHILLERRRSGFLQVVYPLRQNGFARVNRVGRYRRLRGGSSPFLKQSIEKRYCQINRSRVQ